MALTPGTKLGPYEIASLATKTASPVPRVGVFAMLDDHTAVGLSGSHPQMIVVDTKTGATHQGDTLPDDVGDQPVLSPDGRWLYLTRSQTVAHVWLLSVGSPAPPK